jgi:hypothetical protein
VTVTMRRSMKMRSPMVILKVAPSAKRKPDGSTMTNTAESRCSRKPVVSNALSKPRVGRERLATARLLEVSHNDPQN